MTLNGDNPDTVACSSSSNYNDPGASVYDPLDENAADVYAATLAIKNAGSYELDYSYTNAQNRKDTKTRTVNVTNNNTPVISVTGGTGLREITAGDSFTAPSATATDTCEGSINVTVTSTVVPTVTGMYTVTYTATNLGNVTDEVVIDVEVLSATNLDTSGANVPDIASNMVPIYYDSTAHAWKKADSNNKSTRCKWYDYNTSAKTWANAVMVTSGSRSTYASAARGTTISESDVLAYFVWIPRYKYLIASGSGAREITVVWETGTPSKSTGDAISTYRTHPGFTFGATEVTGFWAAKFEASNSTTDFRIKPDVTALNGGANLSTLWTTSRSMEATDNVYGFSSSDVDTHIMKNSEWGAVLYLSRSPYGLNSEIYKNNSSSMYTGRSGGNVSGSQVTVGGNEYIASGFYTYDGKCATDTTSAPGIDSNCTAVGNYISDLSKAYKASSTGTIYGVYDISGGTKEFVMGNYNNYTGSSTSNSGFNGNYTDGGSKTDGVTWPGTQYYDAYTTAYRATACGGSICYGHGFSETSTGAENPGYVGWYDDIFQYDSITDGVDWTYYITASPWILRGGNYRYSGNEPGVGGFSSQTSKGVSTAYASTRIAIIMQ